MTTTMEKADVEKRAGKREWIGMAVLALPTLLVSIDVFVLLLALPHLSSDLGADSTQQLWIMDIYGFMLSGFMITMGTLGDRIGRRKLLMYGAAAFGIASILAAFSTSLEMLIAARALLGVAGATLAPSTLALISNMFTDPRQRALAISVWLVCFMSGAALGPLIGGALLEQFHWGSVFLVGVPAMILLLILGPILLPEYRNDKAGRLDMISVALSLAAILPIVYGLKELAKHGWEQASVASVLIGAVMSFFFVRRQRTLADPLLDLRLFSNRAFSAAASGQMFGTMLLGAIMLFITQYLQLVEGLSPLQAGLWMLPAVAASTVSFLVTPLLARRIRPAYLIGAGLVISIIGLLAVTRVDTDAGLSVLVIAYVLINFGAGPLITLSTDLIVGSAPPEKAGAAASVGETSAEFGFAFGLAALGSLGTAVYRNRIEADIPPDTAAVAVEGIRDTLAGAVTAASTLPDQLGSMLLNSAREAFTSSMHAVALVSAALMIIVAIATVLLLWHVLPPERHTAKE